ncbi:MAG: 50S ribosomal protein L24 [Candidatus Diapherotrites archaeon]|uniref:50S ribosomal protein L24 n=1 Tax=Candidatus Iainarchaeum sp. TaxID=3101447 RepID=A0A8T4KYU0_9ARCH|nr:50S ribosomal protein L24 [Candidatus Diapherotrites archaeon]
MTSVKPGKQLDKGISAPLHSLQKMFSVHLSKDLRKELGKRALEVRKEDTVKVVRGGFKGKTGKVARVNRRKIQAFIEKLSRKKSDGTEVLVPFRPSNLVLIDIYRKDGRRFKGKKIKEKEMKDVAATEKIGEKKKKAAETGKKGKDEAKKKK